MKKFNLLRIIGLLLIVTSCSSNDDDAAEKEMTNYSELIIGEWNYTSQLLNGNDTSFDDECQKDFEYAIYSVNGVFNQTEFENRFGNGCEQVDSSTGTWKIENSTITLTVEGDTASGTILSVNETKMSIQWNIDYDEDGSVDVFIQNFTKRN